MLQDIRAIKSGARELKEFGILIGAVLILLGDLWLWRARAGGYYLLGVGVVFLAAAFAAPGVLKPLQKAWMTLAIVIGGIVSAVILSVVFFALITPIGVIRRMRGEDILDERIDPSTTTYWKDHETPEKKWESYLNQY